MITSRASEPVQQPLAFVLDEPALTNRSFYRYSIGVVRSTSAFWWYNHITPVGCVEMPPVLVWTGFFIMKTYA